MDFPGFYKGKNKWINIPKDASPGPEASAQFKHNERWMRRYLSALGFSWAKNVYPENVRLPYSMHNAEWTTVAALEFIEANKDGPFYLHLCSTLLHGPDKSWRKSMDHPLITGEGEGVVVNALKSSPHADSTIIVLWSDHGFHLGV